VGEEGKSIARTRNAVSARAFCTFEQRKREGREGGKGVNVDERGDIMHTHRVVRASISHLSNSKTGDF
jgi:hypothetical protein